MGLTENEAMRRLLQERYARNGDRPVAFVDESYLAPGYISEQKITGLDPFYLLTAVVIYPENFEQIREELYEIVGANFFHATQYGLDPSESNVPSTMAKYLVDGNEVAVISLRSPAMDSDDMAASRASCYRALLKELYEGTDHDPVRLIVGEKLRDQRLNNWDRRILTEAIKDKVVGRDMSLMLASPSAERLLWLPDLVSNAMYRNLSGTDKTNYTILEPCLTVITVDDEIPSQENS